LSGKWSCKAISVEDYEKKSTKTLRRRIAAARYILEKNKLDDRFREISVNEECDDMTETPKKNETSALNIEGAHR